MNNDSLGKETKKPNKYLWFIGLWLAGVLTLTAIGFLIHLGLN